ncbi:octopamine receptor Oamb-like [Neocloeon triangulifer]|uniref:octopamine receptor Oamb-like n=1 Tax=Neocloeon triangulifer TaxID=2078957 RepID=UPI00286EC127|nr:octopamine receptor Oamb-like [Neocloeon triangulifer]
MEMVEGFVLLLSFLITISVITGNILTIIAILRKPKLNTISNQFILGLAVADLLVGFSIPYDTVMTALFGDKPIVTYSEYAIYCLVSLCPIFLSSVASFLHLMLIGLDRYFAITKPLEHKTFMTKTRARYAVCIAFFIATLAASPPIFWNNLPQEVGDGYGCATVTVKIYYYYFVLLGSYISTWILILLMYAKIARVASARLPNNKKPLKMFAIIVSCYTICWFPFMFCIFPVLYNNQHDVEKIFYISPEVLAFSYILASCNSAMNPIIYAWKLRGFRHAFEEYLRCGIKSSKNRDEPQSSSNPVVETDTKDTEKGKVLYCSLE